MSSVDFSSRSALARPAPSAGIGGGTVVEDTTLDRPAAEQRDRRKRPGRFRRWILRPLFWGLALIAILVFLLQLLVDTPAVRDRARHLIADRLGALLDRQVGIDDISFTLLPLSVEVWGFTISGPEELRDLEGANGTPFLEVPWAAVDVDLQALQRNVIRLSDVRAERPKVFLEYFPGGQSNILRFHRDGSRPRPKTRQFDVYIEHVEVEQAVVQIEQESVRLSLSGDAIRARFQGQGHLHVDGEVVGQKVVLRLPKARPIELSVSGKGSIRRGRIEIASADVSGAGVEVHGGGACGWPLEDVLNKKCEIRYQGTTSGEKLAEVGYFPHLEGRIDFDGIFEWRPRTFGWRMKVEGPRLAIWGRELLGVEGSLKADRHQVHFDLLEASYDGGSLEGTVDFATQQEGRPMAVDIDFDGVPLDRLLADQNIPAGRFASRVSGNVIYRFPLQEGSRGSGWGEVEVAADPEREGLPLEGRFPLTIETGVVHVDSIVLASDRQSVLARGSFDVDARRGRFDYELASADVVPILHAMRLAPDEPGEDWPLWLPTAGEGRVDGTLHLEPGKASTDVGLRLRKVYGRDIPTPHVLAGGFHFDKGGLDQLRLRLSRQDSSLEIYGRMPFASDDPEADESAEPLLLGFDAIDWPLEPIHPWLDFDLNVDGRISGHLDLEVDEAGSLGRLRAKVTPATFFDVPLDALVGRLDWDHERLRVSEMTLEAPAGEMEGEGTLRWSDEETPESLEIDLRARGLAMEAAPLSGYLPRPDLAGELDVLAHLTGSRDQPALELRLRAEEIAVGSRVLESRPSELDVKWADGEVEASGRLLDMVTLSGGGALDRERGDLVFDLDGNDVAGILELLYAQPPAGVGGSFRGHLRVAGELGGEKQVEVELDEMDVDFRGRKLANVEPVRFRLREDYVGIDSLFLEERATGSDLFLTGRLGYTEEAPIDLRLQCTLAASWLELYMPDAGVAGYFDLLGRVGGTVGEPYLDGQGEVRGGRLAFEAFPDFPHVCEGLRGVLLFYPDGMVIDHLEAELANGRIRLEGRADLPRHGEPLRYQLQLAGEDLRVRYPEGWLIEGGADLTLRTLEPGSNGGDPLRPAFLLAGRAHLTNLVYSEDVPLGFTQIVQETLLRKRLEVNPADRLLSAIQLNVEVDGPGALRVKNNLAELTGDIDLDLRGHLSEPIFLGTVELAPGGEVVYSSVDYEIDRGRLSFTHPAHFDPEVDLVATTRVRDFDVILTLSGTMERLNASFTSEPPLPALEVFELLATGGDEELESNTVRRADEIGQEQSMSAASFLYGQAAEVIGERVSTLFGFDKFRIAPLTGSGDNLSKARVTVGKRLSKDVFLSYSADPASTEEQRLRIEWQVGRGLTLVLTQNGDNTYEADARWETSF